MDHQDWKPVILRKSERKTRHYNAPGYKKKKNIDSDDPDAPKTLGMSAGKQIQQGRSAKKMTQKQLAQKINVRPNLIAEYEQGKVVPSRAVLNKINRALGIVIKS
jgi:putative transcription factor